MTTELDWGFRGAVITPGDDGYDAARSVVNGMVDRKPARILRASTPRTWRRRSVPDERDDRLISGRRSPDRTPEKAT